jgi:hypothetical protein
MFTDQIDPIITDFGLVRIMHATTQTASGLVSGTPAYISPEQAQGLKVDHRSDIYSLGVILYEILAGQVPFDAESTWSVIYKHIHEPPPSIPNVQPAIQKIFDRALAKNPDERYQTCRELVVDYMSAIGFISEASTLQFTPVSAPVSTPPSAPVSVEATRQSASIPRPEIPASVSRRSRPSLLPLLGVGFLVLVLGAFGISRLFAKAPIKPTPTQYATSVVELPGESYDATSLPIAEVGSPIGVLRFQDGTAPADEVTLSTSGMPLPPAGSQYEAWLVEDDAEERVSLGIIKFDSEGNGSLSFVDPRGRNLIGMYQGVQITVEPNPDGNPIPSDTIAYAVILPPNGFMHVRHLLYSFSGTPNQIGFLDGLMTDAHLVNTMAQDLLSAYQAGNEAKVRSQAEGMLNVIVGKQSQNYKDWDSNGTIDDPGDGFGLLLNGDAEGYIQGTFSHANLAITTTDATQNMKMHGEHVKIAATNVGGWTATLRDQLILILKTPFGPEMEGMIRNAVALSNQIENGFDVNGNENIEPIPGEGGTKTAYDHAYYMVDILIPAASSATPAP